MTTTVPAPPAPPQASIASKRNAAVAGVVGAGVALAVGELASGLFAGVPSMTVAVGQLFIPFTPEPLKDVAIALFGTTDKAVFVGGVVVVTLLIGAWAGIRARVDRMPAVLLFSGFGLFGLFAGLSVAGSSAILTTLTVVASAAAGLSVLTTLLARATAWADVVAAQARDANVQLTSVADPDALGRRPFLVGSTLFAAGAAASSAFGAMLRGNRIEALVSSVDVVLPDVADPRVAVTAAQSLDIPGITPIIVPNDEFYRIDTALGTPLVDAATWEMKITGMVDRELTLTYDDLLAMDAIERHITIQCVSNEVGGNLVGNALWSGVLLGPLLEEAGIQPGAGQIVGHSVDGWNAGFPIEAAFDRDAMIAFGMNGEPLPAEHGFPARLIVPGLYGYVSATKWLEEIEITTWEGFDGYWIPRGWAKEGPIKTQSRIDVPANGARLENGAGLTVVAGVAWAPQRGVQRVEVRRDEGEWVEAELTEPLSEDTWVQWWVEIDLPEGPSFLQVRATDAEDDTQGADRVPPRPDGAEGHHTIRVFT